MTAIEHVSRSTDVASIVDVLNRDGAIIVDGFLNPSELAELSVEIDGALDLASKLGDNHYTGVNTRRAGRLFGRAPAMVSVALQPQYIESARAILRRPLTMWQGETREEVTAGIQIGMTQAIRIYPGQSAQPLHRDDSSFLWRHDGSGREARLMIIVAVSDFTAENGATMVIPGSAEWDDERQAFDEEAIPAEMKAGSAMMWLGSVYHGGGANRSSQERTGVIMSFDLSYLRQEENQYLSLTEDQIRALPEDIQRLLGWDVGETYTGFIEVDGAMVDPHFLLEDDGVPSAKGLLEATV